jgi:hypothetical protein
VTPAFHISLPRKVEAVIINRWFMPVQSNTKERLFSKHLLFWGACASILWSVYFAVITIFIPYQIEFREGAAQVMTEFLLNRSNPFILENQPLTMNNYGVVYNLVVAPFAMLFGNTLSIHRSVTLVFVLLASLAGSMVIYKVKRDIALSSACAAFIMIGLIARGGIGAFPSAMGTLLFLLAILVPFFRDFDPGSLILSVLCSIAAFYSKPYFVLGFGIVAAYLFIFISKRSGSLYAVLFLGLFAMSLLTTRLTFPLYLINTILGNISNTERSLAHLLSQLTQLLIYFFPILLASVLLLIVERDTSDHKARPALDFGNWNQPIIRASPDYFLFSSLCSMLVFLLFLGFHIGSYLSYAYQLILPAFFCWFFLKLDLQKSGFLLAVVIVVNLFFWQGNMLSPRMLEQKDSKEWARLYSYVRSSSNVLNSPVATSAMIELGLNPLDSGQTSYFYAVKPYPRHWMLGPFYEVFQADGFKYVKFIDSSIEKQKFDLVITLREKSTFYHAKLIERFYLPVDEIQVDMPQTGQQWTVLLWKPLVK